MGMAPFKGPFVGFLLPMGDTEGFAVTEAVFFGCRYLLVTGPVAAALLAFIAAPVSIDDLFLTSGDLSLLTASPLALRSERKRNKGHWEAHRTLSTDTHWERSPWRSAS